MLKGTVDVSTATDLAVEGLTVEDLTAEDLTIEVVVCIVMLFPVVGVVVVVDTPTQ